MNNRYSLESGIVSKDNYQLLDIHNKLLFAQNK